MGWLANGTSGFGTVSVSGRRRVPNPPTRINAFILLFQEQNIIILVFQKGSLAILVSPLSSFRFLSLCLYSISSSHTYQL